MNTHLNRAARILIPIALAFAGSTPAAAATLEVDCSGVTPGASTTIQAAINAAADGDTVLVLPGTCEESIVIDRFIHLIGRDGPNVTKILYPQSGPPGTVVDITVPSGGTAETAVEIAGVQITSGQYGIWVRSNNFVYIHNAVIANHTRYGITNGHGATCYPSTHLVISNSVFDNNGIYGTYWRHCGNSGSTYSAHNNVFKDNVTQATWVDAAAFAGFNLFNGNGGTIPGGWTSNVIGNPCFVGPENGNYHLRSDPQCTSAAIGTGRHVLTDANPDGSRNNIGAFGGPGAANFWPNPPGGPVVTDLQVTPSSVPQGGTVTIRVTGEIR